MSHLLLIQAALVFLYRETDNEYCGAAVTNTFSPLLAHGPKKSLGTLSVIIVRGLFHT